ncbi:hypothetical protein N8385_05580 [Cyclobacteriaceae bacterium]|nr:hypothetical protein [Cyclobacteriaceae bacterium]
MRQAQKTNTESTPTSLQRKEEKNTEHSNKLAEFADNRASIVSQRKLSETIGQKEAKILPFTPNTAPLAHNNAPAQLQSNDNAPPAVNESDEAAEAEKKENLSDIIKKYQHLISTAKNKLEEAHESRDSAAIEKASKAYKDVKAEAKEKKKNEIDRLGELGKLKDKVDEYDLDTADLAGEGIDSEKSMAVAWDPSLLEKEEEEDNGAGPKKKEEEKKKDEPVKEEEDSDSDESDSYEFKFMLAGMEVEGEINPTTKEGNAKATGGPLGKVFELDGKVVQKEDESGYAIDATTTVKGFKTPELKYSLPLARVPLGLPGVFAAVDMDLAASAELGGSFGISCETDSNFKNVQNINLDAVNVNAGAEASIGVFGGVSVGVPGLGEVSVGGEGSAAATLDASVNVNATSAGITVTGKLSGEAKGKLAAVAKAKILWMTKKKSIPIVEGVLGKFEKEISGTTITDEESLKSIAKFGPSNFKRNKKSDATDKAKDSFVEKPEEEQAKDESIKEDEPVKEDSTLKKEDLEEKEEKDSNSYEFKFMLAGMEVEGKVDPTTKEGNATATGGPLGKVLELEGSVKRKEDKSGYLFDATTTVQGFKTPEAKYSLPLARVPLGPPGVFAAVDMDLASSAQLGGNFGISCETDDNFSNIQNINLNAVTVNAGAEASIGIFGGVSVGVPGLGEVSVGGEGSAEATLDASVNVSATPESITLAGTLTGEAKGKLAAVAKGKILWMTKKKSIPIVEGVLGKFEKEITGTTITDQESLNSLAKFGPSNFKRNKKSDATDKAKENFIDKPADEPKKSSWLARNVPSIFGRKK